jgi:hypothetical protein
MAPRDDYRDCPLYELHHQYLTRDEIDDVVRKTVKETLTSMGIDAADPIEMQRDFQTLRDWRRSVTAVRSKGMMTLIAILTTGLLAALWIGVKSVLSKP